MPIEQKFKIFRTLTTTVFVLLIMLIAHWNITRHSGINWFIFFSQCLPLLALLPSLLSHYYRAYSWLCFVTLLYFVASVQGALSSVANASDYLFVLLTVILFISGMMCSRYAQRVQKNWTPENT